MLKLFLTESIDALFHQTLLPESQHSEDLAQNSMASVAKTPLSGKSYIQEYHYSKPKLKVASITNNKEVKVHS